VIQAFLLYQGWQVRGSGAA